MPIVDRYDSWVQQQGYPDANHYIITEYSDGDHHIGYHYDKPKSIHQNSLITVVKTGAHGRPFQLRDRATVTNDRGEDLETLKTRQRQELREQKAADAAAVEGLKEQHKEALESLKKKQAKAQDSAEPFFDKVLEPGTAVIMTVGANLRTQHGVPETPESGPSGSIVFRTITEIVRPGARAVDVD